MYFLLPGTFNKCAFESGNVFFFYVGNVFFLTSEMSDTHFFFIPGMFNKYVFYSENLRYVLL
jgi:hypothetical protein